MEYFKIAEERKRLNLSQLELANKLGVSQKSISKYERGDRRPTYETLMAMAKLFGVSVDYLLGNSNSRISTNNDVSLRNFEKKNNNQTSTSLEETFTEKEKKFLSTFRQLNDDNQDIIIGEMKKTLKEQIHEENQTASAPFKNAK